jgi:hypothetical protein
MSERGYLNKTAQLIVVRKQRERQEGDKVPISVNYLDFFYYALPPNMYATSQLHFL